MNLISRKKLNEFSAKHPQSGTRLNLISSNLEKEFFENVNQVKDSFPNISILKNNRVVFRVCGNKYRLVIQFIFNAKTALVRFIGTHAEYDKIDANTIK